MKNDQPEGIELVDAKITVNVDDVPIRLETARDIKWIGSDQAIAGTRETSFTLSMTSKQWEKLLGSIIPSQETPPKPIARKILHQWWDGDDLLLVLEGEGGTSETVCLTNAKITAEGMMIYDEALHIPAIQIEEPIEALSLPPKMPPWPMERCEYIDPKTGKWTILGKEDVDDD